MRSQESLLSIILRFWPPSRELALGISPFHPNGKYAFVINELNSTLTAYTYDAAKGSLAQIQTLSTLPQGFSGENYCADIHVSADGKFIYGSNRGHDSIVVFGFNPGNGKLSYIENVSTGGKWPRNFALDPSGKFLLVANQNTNNIVSLKVDSNTGKLTPGRSGNGSPLSGMPGDGTSF
jgi:6-phosphogluconolactonase